MDYWGNYTRETVNAATGETTTDTVLLQADPVNRARYERKGYTFVEYQQAPGVGPAIQACTLPNAAEQIFGFKTNGETSDLDDNEIVKQAAEVALRKMTGTWTQAEAVAQEAANVQGEYKPPETPFAIVQGDVLAGYDALAQNGPTPSASTGPGAPVAGTTTTTAAGTQPGADGSGTTAPTPEPTPEP